MNINHQQVFPLIKRNGPQLEHDLIRYKQVSCHGKRLSIIAASLVSLKPFTFICEDETYRGFKTPLLVMHSLTQLHEEPQKHQEARWIPPQWVRV